MTVEAEKPQICPLGAGCPGKPVVQLEGPGAHDAHSGPIQSPGTGLAREGEDGCPSPAVRQTANSVFLHFFSSQALNRWDDAPPYWGEQLTLCSLPAQMLIPQVNPQTLFNQISGLPVIQSS